MGLLFGPNFCGGQLAPNYTSAKPPMSSEYSRLSVPKLTLTLRHSNFNNKKAPKSQQLGGFGHFKCNLEQLSLITLL